MRRITGAAAAGVLSLGLVAAVAPPGAASSTVTPVGTISSLVDAVAYFDPEGIVTGPDRALWYTEPQSAAIGRIDPVTSAATTYALPQNSSPDTIVVGSDGALWFALEGADAIGRIDPTTKQITSYSTGITNSSGPRGITSGPDGAVWFTEWGASRIGRLDVATKAITEYPTPSGSFGTYGITSGQDGAVWFVEAIANKIGRIDVTTKAITEYTVPTASAAPWFITNGPFGDLWFTELTGNKIGRIDPFTKAITEYAIPTVNSEPYGIAVGLDGGVWFTERNGRRAARLDPISKAVAEFTPFPSGHSPEQITTGPDGAMWFPDRSAFKVSRITTGVPGMPTSLTAATTSDQVTLNWSAPADAGASSITSYAVRQVGGSAGCVTNGTTCVVGPLTKGATYTFAVTATNATGTGIASAASNPVVPRTVASAPTAVVALAGNATVGVSWAAPTDDGGAPVTGYVVTTVPGGGSCAVAGVSALCSGLTNGTTYQVTVGAANAVGLGAAAASAAVTPVGAPSEPRTVKASPRSRAAVVSWLAPASTGGSAVTSYEVLASPGGRSCSTSGAARTCTVTGLTNRTSYTFTVRAANAVGVGPSSTRSSAIVAGTATAPRAVAWTFPARGSVKVTWSAPASLGSGAVTAYQVRWSSTAGRTWSTWATVGLTRSAVRAGLTKGHGYLVQVRARNGSGLGLSAQATFVQSR